MAVIQIDQQKCSPWMNDRLCGKCLEHCPMGVFLAAPQPLPLQPGKPIESYALFLGQPHLCLQCMTCTRVCPSGAITVSKG